MKRLAYPVLSAALLSPLAAHAANERLQTVIVTGSRVETTALQSMAPVDVVSAEALAKTGRSDLRRALEELVPSFATSQGSSGGTGKAVKSAALRGLGGNHVLVLVNGKRRHLSALTGGGAATGQSPADLNLIPTSLVERVEVLRDGAAAQYGSDAIAGVINVILKSNDSGGTASLGYGQYTHNEGGVGESGRTRELQINQGLALGAEGGFLSFSLEGINQGNTNYTGPYRDNFLLYPRINGEYDPREFGLSRYRQVWGQPASEGYNIGFNSELPLNDSLSVYANGTASRRISDVNGGFRAATNPLTLTSIFPDGYLSKLQVKEADYQLVAGLRADNPSGWSWDLSSSYGQDEATLHVLDALNASLGPGAPTRYYNGRQIFSEWLNNADLRRSVDTGWFDSPLQVSTGLEFRRSRYGQRAGDWTSYGDGGYVNNGQKLNPGVAFQAGFRPEEAGNWSRHNTSFYLDLTQALNERLQTSVALRLEKYSDVGFVRSGKFSTRYVFNPQVAVRGTLSNGFRAPSLQQSYNQNSQALWQTNVNTAEQEQVIQRNTTTRDPAAIALGAKPLKPEKSTNYSIGLVWTPTPRSEWTLDLYQIRIRDRIQLSSSLNGKSNDQVRKVLLDNGFNPDQDISFYTNVGDTQTRGLDITGNYRVPLRQYGDLQVGVGGNFNRQKLTRLQAQIGETGVEVIGPDRRSLFTEAYPERTLFVNTQWSRGPFELGFKVTHYGRVYVRNNVSAERDEEVKPAFISNISLGYQATDNLKLILGADNLFNKFPEQIPDAALPFKTTTRPYYSEMSPYGYDGRYVYGRLVLTW